MVAPGNAVGMTTGTSVAAAHVSGIVALMLARNPMLDPEAVRRMIAANSPGNLEDLLLSCYLSEDFHEGARAFLEKRKANWQGR